MNKITILNVFAIINGCMIINGYMPGYYFNFMSHYEVIIVIFISHNLITTYIRQLN